VFPKKDISIGNDEGPLGRSTIGIPLRGDSKRVEKLKELKELVPPTTDTAYGTHHTCSAFQSESITRDTKMEKMEKMEKMVNNEGAVDCAGPPL
tara:strand:- start:390 stop:671 length:282 start_codon:yes stop_codon:yes gene_type:complete